MLLLLKVVRELKEKFKGDHIVNFLTGKATTAIKSYKQHEMDLFGCGDENDVKNIGWQLSGNPWWQVFC